MKMRGIFVLLLLAMMQNVANAQEHELTVSDVRDSGCLGQTRGAEDATPTVTIDGLKYYLSPDTHEAFVYNGNIWTGELIIPSEVSYNDETYFVNGLSQKF